MAIHPGEKKEITAHDGRYGPYVKCGKINASLLGEQTIDNLTYEEAIILITNRIKNVSSKLPK